MTTHFPKLLLLAALLGMTGVAAHAQQQPAPQAATQQPPQETKKENAGRIIVVQVTGEVYVFTVGETYRLALRSGSLLNSGQMIATGPKASVMLAFSNGATVTIGESSLVSLDEFAQTPFGDMFKMAEATQEPSSSQTRLDLVRGELIANVKKLNKEEGSTFEVKTPLGVAGIRGTTFQVSYIPDTLETKPNAKAGGTTASFAIVMLEGVVEMTVPNRRQPIVIPQGKQLVLENVDISDTSGDGLMAQDDESTTPSDAPVTSQAMLMQRVQTMLGAAAEISMPGTPGAPAPRPRPQAAGGGNAADGAPDKANQQQEAGEDAGESGDSLSPSPGPQIPAPRLSPVDGTSGG